MPNLPKPTEILAEIVKDQAQHRRNLEALAEILDPGCTQQQHDEYLNYKAEACETDDRMDRIEEARMRSMNQALDAVFGDPGAGRP